MTPSTALSVPSDGARAAAAEPLLSRWLRPPVRAVLGRFFDLRVEGLEHVPAGGPYIVAANHHNYLDGVVLAVTAPAPIRFLVMPRVWRATPLHPLLHRHLGSIPLRLAGSDAGALGAALAALQAGRVVGIFPEGPFSVRGRLESGLPGVALLALRSGAPVVPAGIRGTYEALAGRWLHVPRRQALRVRFGVPRRFSAVAEAGGAPRRHSAGGEPSAGTGRAARQAVTERIMADIADLLT